VSCSFGQVKVKVTIQLSVCLLRSLAACLCMNCLLTMIERLKNPFNPLNAELNPICHLLALLGVNHFLHVSRIRVKSLTIRLLISYTGCPRRNVPDFGRVFLMLKYTDITQNTMSKVEQLRR